MWMVSAPEMTSPICANFVNEPMKGPKPHQHLDETGSFNVTTAAEEKHAENLLGIKDVPELVKAYEAHSRRHAGHAHPDQRQAALGSSGAASVTLSGHEEVHGKKKSKRYCLSNCSGYTGMHPASVVMFAHEAAAEQAGYRKAKNCA